MLRSHAGQRVLEPVDSDHFEPLDRVPRSVCPRNQRHRETQFGGLAQPLLAARPGLHRPPNATPVPGFVLAGDWTHSEYPSTLESAVRSGLAAAQVLLE